MASQTRWILRRGDCMNETEAIIKSRDFARRVALKIAEERDAYKASLEAATKRVEELEAERHDKLAA